MKSVGSKIRLVLAGIFFVGLAGVSAKAKFGDTELPNNISMAWFVISYIV